jgi:hypothetical protein
VGRGWARRTFTTGPGNAAPGWTLATADDFVGGSIAFKEVSLSLAGNPVAPLVAGVQTTVERTQPSYF